MAPARPADRARRKIRVEDRGHSTPCWIWTGATARGYGRIYIARIGDRKITRAVHTVMWEAAHGPAPHDLDPDHLCRVPACCNPDHIEWVTRRENLFRGNGTVGVTHCKHGHEFNSENTYVHENGRRICRRCRADRMIRYKKERTR